MQQKGRKNQSSSKVEKEIEGATLRSYFPLQMNITVCGRDPLSTKTACVPTAAVSGSSLQQALVTRPPRPPYSSNQ